MMDSTTIATLSSLASALLAIACTKGVDAIIKYRKQSREECDLDDTRADKSYQVVIAEFRLRISALEGEVISIRKAWGDEVRELQKEHQDCIRKHERLVAKVEMLERRQNSE